MNNAKHCSILFYCELKVFDTAVLNLMESREHRDETSAYQPVVSNIWETLALEKCKTETNVKPCYIPRAFLFSCSFCSGGHFSRYFRWVERAQTFCRGVSMETKSLLRRIVGVALPPLLFHVLKLQLCGVVSLRPPESIIALMMLPFSKANISVTK